MGHGAGKFLKKTWATVDPVAAKALGADVSWKREALVNPVNAGIRAATDDKVDFTSRESTEGALQGAAAGGSAGGPYGAIAGAVIGGLAGTAQHYQNEKDGVPRQGLFGMKALDEEKVGGGADTLGGGGGSVAVKEESGSSVGGAEVYRGESVGIGDSPEVESAAEQRARIARGRFAGTGAQAFGFTQSERLGA